MHTEIFSTENSVSRLGVARRWEDANRRMVGLELNTRPHGGNFHASMQICFARRLRFSALNVSSHITRLDAVRNPSIAPYHMIACVKKGAVTVAQDGRETHLKAGDFVIVDTARPFMLDTAGMDVRSVDILSSKIREIFPQVDGLTAVAISGQTVPAMLLRSVVENLFARSSEISDDASDFIADAIHYSTASTLSTLPAARDVLPGTVESLHRYRIRNHVRAHLRDRALNPEAIAIALDLPIRYIHKLFEDEPMTLMKWVWAERIDRCSIDLRKRELRNRSVSQIAYSWGFNDPAHFSRLFKAKTGMSPSAARNQAMQRDLADL